MTRRLRVAAECFKRKRPKGSYFEENAKYKKESYKLIIPSIFY